ncbi:thiol reductant ABC exporter subunit CydC [Deinococcus arenicola]|uniref:Thiol reductant ABC exporter subunit CydC n=1 Tax=Deinococcus arenicola TaxID=2994950 RepID=A0ABU4DVR7_9DEIO|nr:thiol reductant ABC exporter subunit CydC [Deinococcus sp. ZS9-10]MDV6376546.1 thiol reductant ABC exporter subunit CydC [Deinococcus sp. ZS9-10]
MTHSTQSQMHLPIFLGILAACAGVGLALTSGVLISRAALRPADFLSLTLLVTAVRGLGLGRAGLRYAERLTGHAAALKAGEGLRLQLFETVSRFGRDLLARERGGDLLSRGGTDVDAAQFRTLRVTLPLAALLGVLALLIGWLVWLDVGLALLAVMPLLLTVWAVWSARARVATLSQEEMNLSRDHAARLLDALAGGGDNAAAHHGPELSRLSQQLEGVALKLGRLSAGLALAQELAFAVAVTGVLWRGAVLVGAGELSGILLAGIVLAAAAAFDAATPLAAVPGAEAVAGAAEGRRHALERMQPAVTAPEQPVSIPAGPLRLKLENVTVIRSDRTVLDGVNLDLRAGETLAVSGPSGGGKTTLARLLSRDLDPDGGRVTLGGIDLRHLAPADLRQRLSLHEQDAPLLDGTLRENLLLGDHHASDGRLRSLLDSLGLTHLDLNAWVGEGGTLLSGGERARVSLARALLKPAELLILDEPTAHLDSKTESRVLEVIAREWAGRAVLIVTHREAPLVLAGRHLILRGGRLAPAVSTAQRKAV